MPKCAKDIEFSPGVELLHEALGFFLFGHSFIDKRKFFWRRAACLAHRKT
jgi:hypothetical protein